jgi:hypothetical protein
VLILGVPLLKRVLLAVGALLTAANIALPIVAPSPVPSSSVLHSANWAGYVAAGHAGEFDGVSAEWRVPKVDCLKTPYGYAAQWVGLDGFSDKTVEQLGTEAVCYYGLPVYGAWFEMYPADPVVAQLAVHAGDLMRASIVELDGEYMLVIQDLTTGKSQATVAKCGATCERSSAEVISEAPSSSDGILPLADFGSVQFSDVRFAAHGSYTTDEIVQRQDGAILQQPSALSDNSFAIVWKGSGE